MPKTRREIAREVDEILRSGPGGRTSKASHHRGRLVDFAARAKREVSSGTEHEIDLVVDAANRGYVTTSQARIAIEWMAQHGGRGTIAFGNEGLRHAGVDLDALKTKMQGTAEQGSGDQSRSRVPRGKISKALPGRQRFRVDVENQPRGIFSSAEEALSHGMRHVYLHWSKTSEMLERLKRGEPVTWAYGFASVEIAPL